MKLIKGVKLTFYESFNSNRMLDDDSARTKRTEVIKGCRVFTSDAAPTRPNKQRPILHAAAIPL